MFVFWLVVGIIIGFCCNWLMNYARKNNLAVKWYDRLLVVIGLIMLVLGIQNLRGSLAEYEPKAGIFSIVMFGVPAVILIGVAFYLVYSRSNSVDGKESMSA